jgi:hypothetical protein
MRLLAALLFLVASVRGAVVIDRIAVIVGKHAIKLSDVERDLRLTAFLNQAPLDLSAKVKRQAADRLVDQQIIHAELASGGYGRATDHQADALLARIQHDRFGDSAERLRAALARYGISKDELHSELLWQLTALQFIQQRFQPQVFVPDETVRSYYDQHATELRREHPQNGSFEALEPDIRKIVEGEQIDKDFEDWIKQSRQQIQPVYREGAFQ